MQKILPMKMLTARKFASKNKISYDSKILDSRKARKTQLKFKKKFCVANIEKIIQY